MATLFNLPAIYEELVTLSVLNGDTNAAKKYKAEGLIKFPSNYTLLRLNPSSKLYFH